MKKNYLTPEIRIQSIETREFLEDTISLPVYDANGDTEPLIEESSQVFSNGTSVWDQD